MMPSFTWSRAAVLTAALSIFAMGPSVRAQSASDEQSVARTQGHDAGMDMTMQHHAAAGTAIEPTMPGQDAFGAIQEIVRILEADPRTDWSKVDLERLRQHLIDMNEVTLGAAVATKAVAGGIQAAVTGDGRTLGAIQRMVPAHAREIEQTRLNGWRARAEPLPKGVLLTVTSADPKEVQRIRGLGFIGVMVSGAHHQLHHLAMARGEMAH